MQRSKIKVQRKNERLKVKWHKAKIEVQRINRRIKNQMAKGKDQSAKD